MLSIHRYRPRLFSVSALLIAVCFAAPAPVSAQANPLAELGKLNPFRPKTQINSLPTSSGLWFRNRTKETVFVAIDYHVSGSNSIAVGEYNLPVVVPDGWMVIGWFEVPPNKMIRVLSGDLKNRYYYYYANSKTATWAGDRKKGEPNKFVHPTNKFSYDSSDPKATRDLNRKGYVLRTFRKIDTQNATGYTINFTSAAGSKPAVRVPTKTVEISFRNRTKAPVRFVINGGDGKTKILQPGKAKKYTIRFKMNIQPVVTITQPNGGTLAFTVEHRGKYDFGTDGQSIKNFYRK